MNREEDVPYADVDSQKPSQDDSVDDYQIYVPVFSVVVAILMILSIIIVMSSYN